MLYEQDIINNKNLFLKALGEVRRAGIGDLIVKLEQSDFFRAPASTKYHSGYEGGLCLHSLNVLNNLLMLVENTGLKDVISRESIIICALFHDLSKANFYTQYARNVKNEFGEWQKVLDYKVRDAKDRFLCHSHSVNSYYLLQQFIRLTDEEACAIMNHHAAFDDSVDKTELSCIYNRYSLAVLLHSADILATYINERIDE